MSADRTPVWPAGRGTLRSVEGAAAVEVLGLSKRYGRHQALHGLDLQVFEGEVVGLLGPNGAGKSTAIKSMVGLLRPDTGVVRLMGHELRKQPLDAKASVGYVPDRPYLYPKLSGRELLRFVGRVRKVDDAERRIDQWLHTFDLTAAANQLVEGYSHGMRQKLAFACALLAEPPVLVVDEPMVGLDPRANRQVREMLRAHANAGNAVLLTTHAMEVAEAVADRVVVLHRGKTVASGTVAELRLRLGQEEADLEEIFLLLTREGGAAEDVLLSRDTPPPDEEPSARGPRVWS